MKQALILHGTDVTPEFNWFPWLRKKLEAAGYEVWAPQLPECHTPNRQVYNDFLFGSGYDFTDNILIGHSSGAVEVLNLPDDERLPHIRMAALVSPWAGGKPNGYDTNVPAGTGPVPGRAAGSVDYGRSTWQAHRL